MWRLREGKSQVNLDYFLCKDLVKYSGKNQWKIQAKIQFKISCKNLSKKLNQDKSGKIFTLHSCNANDATFISQIKYAQSHSKF